MPSVALEVLKQGFRALKKHISPRKEALEKRLAENESMTSDDERWLDGEGNVCDEEWALKDLETASDYERGWSRLNAAQKKGVKRLKDFAEAAQKKLAPAAAAKPSAKRKCPDHPIIVPAGKTPGKKKITPPTFQKKELATLEQRIEILDWYHANGKNQSKTAKHFDPIYPNLCIKQPLVSSWVNKEQEWRATGGGITPAMLEGMTHDQAVALLQKFGYAAFPSAPAAASACAPPNPYSAPAPPASNVNAGVNGGSYSVGGGYDGGGSGGSGGGNTSPEAHRSGFYSSFSPSNSNVSDAYNSNANANGAVPHYTDESIGVRRGGGEEASFGYPARSAYEVPTLPSASATTIGSNPFVGGSTGTSSFSPFSPDPNQLPQQQQHQGQQQQQQHGAGELYAAAEMFGKRRDSYAGQPYGQGLPHPSKAYAPGFFPVPPVLQTNGSASRSAGSGLGSPTRGGYGGGEGDGFAGSPPAFQVNRYQRHAQPISRPNSGSARRGGGEFGLDAMHDLNGTLASLDLDQREERGVGGWGLLKSPTATEASVGGESSASGTSGTSGSGSGSGASSGGSVQFRMSMESP
ncbi:hypothetical protein B0H14DRAFT_3884152 [Mycena olivaceomarginata]|nr:hypothetical protein B0H14DRAFT_3884152 [Mycena olivaceomarginata]